MNAGSCRALSWPTQISATGQLAHAEWRIKVMSEARCRVPVGYVWSHGLLCQGAAECLGSREFPYQKGEEGLNLSISGLCRKFFCFGFSDVVPEVLNTVFKSCPNDGTQGTPSRTNWYNFLTSQCLTICFGATRIQQRPFHRKMSPLNKQMVFV